MKRLASLVVAVSVLSLTTAAQVLAHEGEDHNGDERGTHNPQGHGSSFANTPAWQSSWAQSGNPNYGYYQNYQSYFQKHPTDHRVLEQSEAQYHQLLEQGRITQREHQMLDAQLRAQHAQKDAALQNNFNRYGYPYVNRSMPKLLNKLRRLLNY